VRVLVLTYETPAWPAGGGAGRIHALLEPLASRHAIRVLSTGGQPRVGRSPAGVELRLIEPGAPDGAPPGGWLGKNARHYLRGDPWLHHLAAHHARALAAALPAEMARFRPDLVQVEHGELGGLVAAVPAGVPTVLVLHNLLTVVQAQLARGAGWEAVKHALEVPVMARAERRHAGAASAVVVTTETDRRLVHRLRPRVHVDVVPNCVIARPRALDRQRSAVPRLVFTASFHYPPNQRAAVELLDTLLPAVRRRVAGAELVLAGQQVPAWLRARVAGAPGARLCADPADMRPLLDSAWLAVAPLRSGSGSPLKVLEALAAGVPVVTTPRVARALELGREDGVLVADDAPGLAAAACAVLDDARLRDRLGAAGERVVAERFDSIAAADRLDAVWRRAADRR
jgi:polysaccharide biosynthesis protein PslH